MAWLLAVPEADRELGQKSTPRSRYDEFKLLNPDKEPELPTVGEEGAHLVDYLFEVGPGEDGHAVTWREVQAWTESTGVQLSEFEAGALRSLSLAYVSMYHDACKKDCPPPYLAESQLPDKAELSKRLGDYLRSIKGRTK